MVKPADNKENNNNPNNKKPVELSPGVMMLLNNVVVIAIVVIALIVAVVFLNSSMKKEIAKVAPTDEQAQSEDEEERQEGVMLDLGEFILNLADTSARRYLKIGIALEVSKTEEETALQAAPAKSGGHGHEAAPVDINAKIEADMQRYKPAMRDVIISVLSNKTSDELSTPVGKEIAKEEILENINAIFEGQREVMRVSFGQFIIQ